MSNTTATLKFEQDKPYEDDLTPRLADEGDVSPPSRMKIKRPPMDYRSPSHGMPAGQRLLDYQIPADLSKLLCEYREGLYKVCIQESNEKPELAEYLMAKLNGQLDLINILTREIDTEDSDDL